MKVLLTVVFGALIVAFAGAGVVGPLTTPGTVADKVGGAAVCALVVLGLSLAIVYLWS